jgi:hypothetical protein
MLFLGKSAYWLGGFFHGDKWQEVGMM